MIKAIYKKEKINHLLKLGRIGLLSLFIWLQSSTFAQTGSSLNFDGSNDHITIPNDPSLNLLNVYTFEAWVNPANTSTFRTILSKGDLNGGAPAAEYALQIGPNNQLLFYATATNGWIGTNNNVVNNNVWQHVAVTNNGSRISFYVNGIMISSTPVTSSSLSFGNHSFYIGRQGSGCNCNFMNGSIDEVRVWNIARTPCDIYSFSGCEIPTSASGLVANYHFNQGVAGSSNTGVTTLIDASGNNLNGTLSNFSLNGSTSNWVTPGGVTSGNTSALSCVVASALNFDGTNDFVSVPNTSSLQVGGGNFTVEFWARPTLVNGNFRYAVTKDHDNTSMEFLTGIGTNNKWFFYTKGLNIVQSISNAVANTWYHIACTYDGTKSSFYINGALQGTVAVASTPLVTNANLLIGARTATNVQQHFIGDIDEVRIWNIARSQCDITHFKDCEIPTTASGLVANYHFNQGAVGLINPGHTTLFNSASNSSNGTLNNFALTGSTSNWIGSGGVTSGNITPSILQAPGSITGSSTLCPNFNAPYTVVAIPGATSYSWSLPNGWTGTSTTNFISITASGNSGNVSVIASNSCVTTSATVKSVTVYPSPTISVSNFTVCAGTTISLTPSGANAYFYSNGSATLAPTNNTTVGISGLSSFGCASSNTAISTISVNSRPTISVNNPSICAGNSAVISPSATGVNVFNISGGNFTVNPTSNSSYSVTATGTNGCASSNTAISNVIVNALPIISATNGTICSGQSFTINASGANTYTYTGGSNIVSPTTNATYSITGTSAEGCISSNTAISNIVVNSTPTISANNGTICSGESFTILATGADSYTYTSGSNVVSPATSTVFQVVGSSSLGCSSSNTVSVNLIVNSTPTITVNNGTICSGQNFTIIATGADSYTYSGGSNVVSPTTNTNYQVTGTSSLGCAASNTAQSNVIVNLTPSITVNNGAICVGESFTLVPSGADTYSYSNGSNVVTPNTTTSFTVSGTSSLGCISSNNAVSTITVNSLPTIVVVSSKQNLCNGESATLSASGALTYLWSNAAISTSISVNPIATTVYSVGGIDANGCASAISFTQSVSECTGISEAAFINSIISVYPNPNNGSFTINSDVNMTISIINELGQVVGGAQLSEDNQHNAYISELSSGIYFVIGKSEQGMVKQKIIVTK